MHYRAPNTVEAALESDVFVVGGQHDAAHIIKRSQKHVSNCLHPNRTDSFYLYDLMHLCDEIKTQGKVPEVIKFLASRYGLFDEMATIDHEVEQISESINRVRNKTRPLNSKVEALRA